MNDEFSFVGTEALTEAGQIHATQDVAKDVTYVEGNLDADPEADFLIEIKGLHTFAASDAIL